MGSSLISTRVVKWIHVLLNGTFSMGPVKLEIGFHIVVISRVGWFINELLLYFFIVCIVSFATMEGLIAISTAFWLETIEAQLYTRTEN